MKKALCILMPIALMISGFAFAEQKGIVYGVKGDSNIRKSPSLNGELTGYTLNNGKAIAYTGETVTDDNGLTWYSVSYKEKVDGYVSSAYTYLEVWEDAEATEEPTATEEPAPTEEPAATEEPAPSEEPAPTEAPAPTEEPTATEAPVATEAPEGTSSFSDVMDNIRQATSFSDVMAGIRAQMGESEPAAMTFVQP